VIKLPIFFHKGYLQNRYCKDDIRLMLFEICKGITAKEFNIKLDTSPEYFYSNNVISQYNDISKSIIIVNGNEFEKDIVKELVYKYAESIMDKTCIIMHYPRISLCKIFAG